MMSFSLFFLLAILLDLLCGDPHWFPHPVRIIGWFCIKSEIFFRRFCGDKPKNLRYAGLYTVITILFLTGFTLFLILFLCSMIDVWVEVCCAIILLYTAIATKDLLVHSKRVYFSLKEGDLTAARKNIQMIVGRDTAKLDTQGIIRACIETVAENMADGIIAPIFWASTIPIIYNLLHIDLFIPSLATLQPISIAALGALLYKACNTMDSMYGYKNEKYIDFGRYPALLDDIVNYIPARLTAISIIAAAFLLRLNSSNSIKICWRDRDNHSSPNAGYPEAAMAGALDIMLGGNSFYFGKLVKKPTIGDANRKIAIQDIFLANQLVLVGTIFYCIVLLLLLIQIFSIPQ